MNSLELWLDSEMIRRWHFLLGLLIFVPISSITRADTPSYSEVSAASGITFQSETNAMSAGIGWIDFDNDGWDDLYVPNQSGPNRLYKNVGNGQFSEIASQAGAQLTTAESQGVAVGDYDGDGFDDLFVANAGMNSLLRNNGDGTFSDMSLASGIGDRSVASFDASFGDLDGDGDLDLYVGHWDLISDPVSGSLRCEGNDLYLNNGNGTFTNVSVESGTDHPGCSFAVPMTDFDQDGDLDILVVNDDVEWVVQFNDARFNELLRNDGVNANGVPVFTPAGAATNMNQEITAMGVAIGDYNNDTYIDYYRSQCGPGVLSTNDGTARFDSVFLEQLPGGCSSTTHIGWGAAFLDTNNDGFVDLYRGNSYSGFGPSDQYNLLHMNNGDGTFTEAAAAAGVSSLNAGLGVAVSDYDKDGDIDIAVHGQFGDVNLFRNDTASTNHWLKVRLIGNVPNVRGIGATLRLLSREGTVATRQMREIHAGSSHGSNHSFVQHFGLGQATEINSLAVFWPDGCTQILYDVNIDQEVSVNRSGCTGNFAISGTVLDQNGQPVSGLELLVNDNLGFASNVVTDANGEYTQNVPSGLYIVMPTASDPRLVCSPTEGNVFTSVKSSHVQKDFACQRKHYVTGTLRTLSAGPIVGANVYLANNAGFSTNLTTDANGQFSQLVPDEFYLTLPSVNGLFSCTAVVGSIFFSVNGSDVVKDFVCSVYTISGTVLSNTGDPMQGIGVIVNDNFGFSSTVFTDANGDYFQYVKEGLYIALPMTDGFICGANEGSIVVSVSGADASKDFTCTPSS